jgi:hypothetical protein
VIDLVNEYAAYLSDMDKVLEGATVEDLETYVDWIEMDPKVNAKKQLWAIRYYYQFTGDTGMERHASELRQARISRQPFALRDFRGVDPAYIDRLEQAGIKDVEQMLAAGGTPRSRQALAAKSGVPQEAILEFVKLSDLARIPGLKRIRARLYYDAGVDTVEKIAAWEPQALLAMLTDFVEQSGFDGMAPLPKEVQHAVQTATKLPLVVDYEEQGSRV